MSLATFSRALSHSVDHFFPTPQFLLPKSSGIDISDSSIKWLTLNDEGLQKSIASWGNEPLAGGIVKGGIIQNQAALSERLAQIKPHIKAHAAHAALPEEAAYVFGMHVPHGSNRAHILSMIEFEFDGRVPLPASSAVYDYSVIAEGEEGIEIGVVVFAKELAESYASAFAGAGIELLSLEVEAQSIARSASSTDTAEPITLLVDFGRARTGFAVIKRGVPIFSSTVEVGGDSMAETLQRAFGYSHEVAQKYWNTEGLIGASGGKSAIEAILPTVSALADEIERHFRYWDSRRNEEGKRVTPVGKILLLGGSSNIRGLPEYIAGRVHAEVEYANVWRHICNTDTYIPEITRRDSLQFATAAGLALRDF